MTQKLAKLHEYLQNDIESCKNAPMKIWREILEWRNMGSTSRATSLRATLDATVSDGGSASTTAEDGSFPAEQQPERCAKQ
jgi:hypothetical protein